MTERTTPPGTPFEGTELQDLPVEALKNVGVQVATVLRSRGFNTVGELLTWLPRRYLDLRQADDWRLVRHGAIGSLVALEAVVRDSRFAGPPKAQRLMLSLCEPRGNTLLRAVFFNARSGIGARAHLGATLRVIGVLREGATGPELVQPRILSPTTRTRPIEATYGAIGTLPPGTVARVLASALEQSSQWADPVPPELAQKLGLISPAAALRAIHQPDAKVSPAGLSTLLDGTGAAHRRLGFEELLALSVALERMRRMSGAARVFQRHPEVSLKVASRLGLVLTRAQCTAIDTLLGDLTRELPMRRLLVGDVGSGKTAVALALTLAVLREGGSAAWLCPTTLVAEQHARTLERALGGEGGPIAVLLGSTPARARKQAERVISQGLVRMVVGTHGLLEGAAMPPGVGLVVIDEQHRFGVAQRVAMVTGKTPVPHMLVMSATPIPRTLALAQYGDLDLATLTEGPVGRQIVTTRVLSPSDRGFVLRTIERALAADGGKGRVFVVVPRIDAEEGLGTGIAEADRWLSEAFGNERIVTVHGRLSTETQREGIDAFRRGSHPILLGTTVVEVGLDVPEANLMVVLGAEHFGVAQLHQLRGRVGRGGQKAGCLLVSESVSETATARLGELAGCHDGFALAERDMARRGAGEWFGARQSGGDTTLRFADPLRDPELVSVARQAARDIVDADPTLARHPTLARAVRRLLARGAIPVGEEAG